MHFQDEGASILLQQLQTGHAVMLIQEGRRGQPSPYSQGGSIANFVAQLDRSETYYGLTFAEGTIPSVVCLACAVSPNGGRGEVCAGSIAITRVGSTAVQVCRKDITSIQL